MKLEPPFLIDERKLTHYLLIRLAKNDKSNYLNIAGYHLANWQILEEDLLSLVAEEEATFEGSSIYGNSYSIIGSLTGPNGRSLVMKMIWLKEKKSGFTKFITLYPSALMNHEDTIV